MEAIPSFIIPDPASCGGSNTQAKHTCSRKKSCLTAFYYGRIISASRIIKLMGMNYSRSWQYPSSMRSDSFKISFKITKQFPASSRGKKHLALAAFDDLKW